ncbi:MAG: RsmB/NOP family class I SAM-dependent RNA methyltransferase [Burkholderiales bacterium]
MPITSAQLSHLSHALHIILPLRTPADVALKFFFRDQRELGQGDRAFIAENVYAILRKRRLLEYLIPEGIPRQMALAALVKLQGVGIKELAPLLRDGEETLLVDLKSRPLDALPFAVQADLPDWVVEKLRAQMPDGEILALARSLQNPAPLDLRVNTLRTNRHDVLLALKQAGIEASPTPYSPVGIRVKGKPALNKHELFLDGKIEIQDEGSQLLAILLEPKRNDMVADFCAGAGGKTLAIGAIMQSLGRLYAFDVSEKRLANLKPRLKRSGLSNVHPARIANENDLRIKRLAGKIDRVLVDAPCSGLGTLRRNPDLKWRQSEQAVLEMTQKQYAILTAAARLVKPGGRLVYATCSLLAEENERIAEEFLAAHPQFMQLNVAEILVRQKIPLDTGMTLKLLPNIHNTDGFFAAVFERKQTTD